MKLSLGLECQTENNMKLNGAVEILKVPSTLRMTSPTLAN